MGSDRDNRKMAPSLMVIGDTFSFGLGALGGCDRNGHPAYSPVQCDQAKLHPRPIQHWTHLERRFVPKRVRYYGKEMELERPGIRPNEYRFH